MATQDQTSVSIAPISGEKVDLIYWLRQNHVNIERIIGKKLDSLTLSYTAGVGYAVNYTEAAPAPAPAATASPAAPPTDATPQT